MNMLIIPAMVICAIMLFTVEVLLHRKYRVLVHGTVASHNDKGKPRVSYRYGETDFCGEEHCPLTSGLFYHVEDGTQVWVMLDPSHPRDFFAFRLPRKLMNLHIP